MIAQSPDFHFRKILKDGRKLEIKLENSSLAEHLICLKLVKHIILALSDLQKFQRQALVEKFISDSMEKLKCRKQ